MTARLWRSGARGTPILIRGIPATIRAGYHKRLVRVCAYCGDHDSGAGWHNGSLLRQHVKLHGMCADCRRDYHPFGERMARLEKISIGQEAA